MNELTAFLLWLFWMWCTASPASFEPPAPCKIEGSVGLHHVSTDVHLPTGTACTWWTWVAWTGKNARSEKPIRQFFSEPVQISKVSKSARVTLLGRGVTLPGLHQRYGGSGQIKICNPLIQASKNDGSRHAMAYLRNSGLRVGITVCARSAYWI